VGGQRRALPKQLHGDGSVSKRIQAGYISLSLPRFHVSNLATNVHLHEATGSEFARVEFSVHSNDYNASFQRCPYRL
jgi:pectate lyase